MKNKTIINVYKVIGVIIPVLIIILSFYSLVFTEIRNVRVKSYDYDYFLSIYEQDSKSFSRAVEFIDEKKIVTVSHSKNLIDKDWILIDTLYYEFDKKPNELSKNNILNELFDRYDFDVIVKENDSVLFYYPDICLIHSKEKKNAGWNEIDDNWYLSNTDF